MPPARVGSLTENRRILVSRTTRNGSGVPWAGPQRSRRCARRRRPPRRRACRRSEGQQHGAGGLLRVEPRSIRYTPASVVPLTRSIGSVAAPSSPAVRPRTEATDRGDAEVVGDARGEHDGAGPVPRSTTTPGEAARETTTGGWSAGAVGPALAATAGAVPAARSASCRRSRGWRGTSSAAVLRVGGGASSRGMTRERAPGLQAAMSRSRGPRPRRAAPAGGPAPRPACTPCAARAARVTTTPVAATPTSPASPSTFHHRMLPRLPSVPSGRERTTPEPRLSLAGAVELTRTGDLWLFRGRSAADRAIQVTTNSPVNHVGMAVVLDDLPPLMWHAELGRSLPDVWTGTPPARRPAARPARRGPGLGAPLRPAGLAAPARPAGHARRWRTPCCGRSPGSTARRSRRRPGWPAAGSRGRLPRVGAATARDVGLETAYCAEVVALTYEAMGLLPAGRRPDWYDPGRFWSGDDLAAGDRRPARRRDRGRRPAAPAAV